MPVRWAVSAMASSYRELSVGWTINGSPSFFEPVKARFHFPRYDPSLAWDWPIPRNDSIPIALASGNAPDDACLAQELTVGPFT